VSVSSKAEQLHFLTDVLARERWRRGEGLPPIGIGPDQNLRQHCTESVNRDVTGAGLANWYEGLVPFVQSSEGQGDEEGTESPVQAPPGPAAADPAKNHYAEHAELGDVRQLADSQVEKVHHSGRSCGKNPAQQGINKARGVFAAEVLRGKERNQKSHADCRDPVSEALCHCVGEFVRANFPDDEVLKDRQLRSLASSSARSHKHKGSPKTTQSGADD